MIPSDLLLLNRNEVIAEDNVIRQGIEFDAIGRVPPTTSCADTWATSLIRAWAVRS